MRKILMGVAFLMTAMVLSVGTGLADMGRGPGNGGYHGGKGGGHPGGGYGGGPGNGTGTPYICEYGEDATVSGIVVNINLWGEGMVVAVNEENTITVYGLGPWWYWEDQNNALPSTGDRVTVSVKYILINEYERNVAMSLTNNTTGQSINLRDSETCYPYWLQGR